MDFNIIAHNCWVLKYLSKFNFQVNGLEVKVSVANFRKNKTKKKTKKKTHTHTHTQKQQQQNNNVVIALVPKFINRFQYNHRNVGYDNISSKFYFQVAGLKVKVTVVI